MISQNLFSRFVPFIVAALLATGCTGTSDPSTKSAFIDIHDFGPGKVTAAAVAEAHRADLAAQGKHGVQFVDYWVDEEHGKVYCLSEAPDAHSVVDTHREAHGLLPSQILPVVNGQATTTPATGGKILFLDVHELGPGKVSAHAVAEAHLKDLETQGRYGVHFLNYWVDEANGKVLCLSEAPNAEAIRETHREAHGLLPDLIVKVTPAP